MKASSVLFPLGAVALGVVGILIGLQVPTPKKGEDAIIEAWQSNAKFGAIYGGIGMLLVGIVSLLKLLF